VTLTRLHASENRRIVVSIVDNDPPPTLGVSDASVVEGNSGTKPVTVTVALSSPSDNTVTVSYSTRNQEAIAPQDYTFKQGQLTFQPGEVAKTVTLDVAGDLVDEVDEHFLLALANPVNAFVGDVSGVVTLVDDDDTGVCAGPDVVFNGGAEMPLVGSQIPGWTMVGDNRWKLCQPNLQFEGLSCVQIAPVPGSELVQDVDVAALVAAFGPGGADLSFEGWYNGSASNGPFLASTTKTSFA